MALGHLRIFISSPGDVAEERVLANNLIRRLADEYTDQLWIEPVFWEHEPLLAHDTFQSQIPPPSQCQIVVCILWSRLGTRLIAQTTRPDGTRFASGTEYEFEEAIEGRKKNGYPDLLVYRKIAEPLASLKDEQKLLARLAQKKALDSFIQKWFFDETDGSLKAAFHPFETSAQFELVLEEHLRKLISRRLPEGVTPKPISDKPSWTKGSPFRGLDVFYAEHAPIFFGRTRAVSDVITSLRKQATEGRAFVLLLGASGSGKSSLARAGVLPLLMQRGVIEGVSDWRRAALRPSDSSGDLFLSLANALLAKHALPELSHAPADLAKLLRENPKGTFLQIKVALAEATAGITKPDGSSKALDLRLVLLVDQLEELFTLEKVTAAERAAFTDALSSLARGGKVWIIATLRSDFYPRCAELPELIALKEGAGQYDLLLPTAAEIGQMIRQPARAAGLSFEENPQTRQPLDEALRDAAAASPESLPLLEFALDELFKQRNGGTLTWAAYQALGGVEGALATRAEATFATLSLEVQATLPHVLRSLVSAGDDTAVVRRQAPLPFVASTPAAAAFVHAFVKARLFAADRAHDGSAVVRVTHEAFLRNWPRLSAWLEKDRELLRIHGRVSTAAGRWDSEGRRSDLLLPDGKPLIEAQTLLTAIDEELTAGERQFIIASKRRAMAHYRAKRAAVAALVVLTLLALIAGYYADHQRTAAIAALADAERQRIIAQNETKMAQQEEAKAEANSQKAETLNTMLISVVTSADPDSGNGADYTVRQMLKDSVSRLSSDATLSSSIRAAALLTIGQAMFKQGNTLDAKSVLENALGTLTSDKQLNDPIVPDIKRALALCLQGDEGLALAKERIEDCIRIFGVDAPQTRQARLDAGAWESSMGQDQEQGEWIAALALIDLKTPEQERAAIFKSLDAIRKQWRSGSKENAKSEIVNFIEPFLKMRIVTDNVPDALVTVASHQHQLADDDTAEPLMLVAIDLAKQRSKVPFPLQLGLYEFEYGKFLLTAGRLDEAVVNLKDAFVNSRFNLGEKDPKTFERAAFLIEAMEASGKGDSSPVIIAQLDKFDSSRSHLTHHAAANGLLRALNYFVQSNPDELTSKNQLGWLPLHYAAREDQVSAVQYLLEHGSQIDSGTDDGDTPLHAAAIGNAFAVTKFLVEHNANINASSNYGTSPLHLAAHYGDTAIAKLLLEHGASVDARDNIQETPLMYAVSAKKPNIDCVHLLLNHSANVQAANNVGMTPLYYAASVNNRPLWEALLNAGASVSALTGDRGFTPIDQAALNDNVSFLQFLLDRHFSLAVAATDGSTPLHIAAQGDALDVAEFLITHGAWVAIQDKNGETPLHSAARYNSIRVAELLIQKGAKLNVENDDGWTPLDMCSLRDSDTVAKLLVHSGSDVMLRVKGKGLTPLHLAVTHSALNLAKVLLDNGADANAESDADGSPLHQAAANGNIQMIRLLLDHHANVDLQDQDGETPLEFAAFFGKKDVYDLLVKAGASPVIKDKNGHFPGEYALKKGWPTTPPATAVP